MPTTVLKHRNVEYSGNRITVHNLKHPADVSDFYNAMAKITSNGIDAVYIDLNRTGTVFPNAAVPISAAIDHYVSNNISITIDGKSRFVNLSKLDMPQDIEEIGQGTIIDPLSRVWRFSSSRGICTITENFTESLSEKSECKRGVIEGFEWCINEIMDNVLQHSQSSYGYIMGQLHQTNKKMAICIADTGIGLYESLKSSAHRPRTSADAISLAVREGVTRDTAIGQGNGLWGLLEIITHNKGALTITSGPSSIFNWETNVKVFNNLPCLSKKNHGTIVDFQINLNTEIDISQALKYNHINLRLEQFENDAGELAMVVVDHAHGTGTRRSAEALRNKIINILNESRGNIVLDFSGIGIVSSSFADELIGKMIVNFGFFNFQSRIKMTNMSDIVQGIVHKAIAQRMSQSLM